MSCLRIRAALPAPLSRRECISSETGVFFNSVRSYNGAALNLKFELNVVNGMAGVIHACYGYQLMSVRCLVTGKYAELETTRRNERRAVNLSTSRKGEKRSDS